MRYISLLLLVVLITGIFTIGVYAATWEFRYPTNCTDNTTTSRTYVPVLLGYGAQALIDTGKINSNGLNTNMQIGDTSIKYMLSTTNVAAAIPSLPSNGTTTVNLYTGYSPLQTSFPMIFGYGGYATKTDVAAMELSGNFSLVFTDTYVNTSASANLFSKSNTIKTECASGNLTTTIYGAGVESWVTGNVTDTDSQWTGDANASDNNTGTFAQCPTSNHPLVVAVATTNFNKVRIYSWDLNEGVDQVNLNATVEVYYSSAWHTIHTGAIAGGALTEINVGSEQNVTQIRVTPTSLTYVAALYEVQAQKMTYTSALSLTGLVTTGEHDITLSADSTNLTLMVDSIVVNSVALGAVTVQNTTNSIVIGSTATSYIGSLSWYVGGGLVAQYAPDTMISGTTLSDETGNGYSAVITWGTNSGIALSYGEMASYASMVSVPSSTTDGFDMDSALMPATWFAMGENIEDLPFYDMVHDAVVAMDFVDDVEGVQTIYFIIIIGIAFAVFLGVVMFTRSALMAYLGLIIVLFVGSSMTIIPMWIPFVLIIVGFGIMYLYRQVAY